MQDRYSARPRVQSKPRKAKGNTILDRHAWLAVVIVFAMYTAACSLCNALGSW